MNEKNNVENLINKALQELITKDKHLLDVDVNERSLTHRLAVYLEKYLPDYLPELEGYSVDCEYNRNGEIPKEIFIKITEIKSDDTEAITVFPDIIIHRRGSKQAENFLVIEAKKATNQDQKAINFDRLKLRAFKSEYKYRYCYFLIFPTVHDVQNIKITDLTKLI